MSYGTKFVIGGMFFLSIFFLKENHFSQNKSLNISSLEEQAKGFKEVAPPVPQRSLKEALKSDFIVTQLNIPLEDLYGPKGILFHDKEAGIDNRLLSGREWEREAEVVFYKKNKEIFKSGVGARIHGGKSRHAPDASFRIYMRKEFGKSKIPKNLIFKKTKTMKRFVIHRQNEFIGFFTKPIIRMLGGETPKYRPTLFFLNEKYMGTYYLNEHLHPKHWEDHYIKNKEVKLKSGEEPKKDYYFVRSKNTYVPEDDEYEGFVEYNKLKNEWVLETPTSELYSQAKERFDMKNYMQHMFSFAFLGTTDWQQGAAVLDGVSLGNPWKFISWDLEHSIVDIGVLKENSDLNLNRKVWEQESFELILSEKRFHTNKAGKKIRKIRHFEIRKIMFFRLWMESAEFRKDFTAFAEQTLQSVLTQKSLDALVKDTLALANEMTDKKIQDHPHMLETLEVSELFFRCRRKFVKQRLKDINKFPLLEWDFRDKNEHFDTFKYFEKHNTPISCE